MRCKLCESQRMSLFHKGVRDNAKIDVMRCDSCGLLQLSSFDHCSRQFYEKTGMRQEQYNAITDSYENQNWELWIEETLPDDSRRYEALKNLLFRKDVLDFGCGNGGFLRKVISGDVRSVAGIELDKESRERLSLEQITVYPSISKAKGSYDVITMFQVIEHLDEPALILKQIYDKLRDRGYLIVETPNSEDALISLYESRAFKDFTFWSAHVILYQSQNLEKLINSIGFETVHNGQIQRYPLSNHLYWLSKESPGGHEKWKFFNAPLLDSAYENALHRIQKCDTLFAVFKKGCKK